MTRRYHDHHQMDLPSILIITLIITRLMSSLNEPFFSLLDSVDSSSLVFVCVSSSPSLVNKS